MSRLPRYAFFFLFPIVLIFIIHLSIQLTQQTRALRQLAIANADTNTQLRLIAGETLKLQTIAVQPTSQPAPSPATSQPPAKPVATSHWHPIDAAYTRVVLPVKHGTVYTLQKLHIMKRPPTIVASAT